MFFRIQGYHMRHFISLIDTSRVKDAEDEAFERGELLPASEDSAFFDDHDLEEPPSRTSPFAAVVDSSADQAPHPGQRTSQTPTKIISPEEAARRIEASRRVQQAGSPPSLGQRPQQQAKTTKPMQGKPPIVAKPQPKPDPRVKWGKYALWSGTALTVAALIMTGAVKLLPVVATLDNGVSKSAEPTAVSIDNAQGNDDSASPSPASVTIVKNMEDRGVSMKYMGKLDGLDSYLALKKGVIPQPVYITPSGHSVILGQAYDDAGNDLTRSQLAYLLTNGIVTEDLLKASITQAQGGDKTQQSAEQRQDPQAATAAPSFPNGSRIDSSAAPQQSLPQNVSATADDGKAPLGLELTPLQRNWVEKSNWIPVGKPDAPHIVYMLVDPNCPHCHATWNLLMPQVNAGKLQVRAIMIGAVTPDSIGVSMSVLESSSPQNTLLTAMNGFGKVKPDTFIKFDTPMSVDGMLAKADEEAKAKTGKPLSAGDRAALRTRIESEAMVIGNHDFMQRMNLTSVPALFYMSEKVMHQYSGEPTSQELKAILGLMD